MKNKSNSLLVVFSILDSIFWAYFAVFLGFMTTYFLECGMTNSMLSLVLAVYMACSFLGSFFWGSVSDRRRTNKRVFLPLLLVSMLLGLAIFFLAPHNILLVAILYPVIGFLVAPLGSCLDTWMIRSFDNDTALYGKARGIGSAGYAVAMLAGGQLVKRIGYWMIPVMTLVLYVPVFLITLLIREKPMTQTSKSGEKADVRHLLSVRVFIILLIVLFTSGMAVSPVNNLKIVMLKNVGGDVGILGLDSFLGVLVQAVFIFTSGKLKRIPTRTRLLLMSLCLLMTLLLNGFAQSPAWIIIGTLFSNVAFGFMLPTSREIVSSNVPESLITTANSLSDAMYGSFSGVVALSYSGFVMDRFGPRSVAYLGAFILIIPITINLVSILRAPHRRP